MDLPRIEIDPDSFLKHEYALPPLPEVVISIQRVINSESANVNNISSMIVRDPALTAQVLKVVNSAYYGFKNEITDIRFAVAYLGIHEIYNMVLSLAVVETLDVQDTKILESFWDHSVYAALCARFLAKKFEPLLAPEQIWIGGLLHDIGKLVLYKFFPDHFRIIRDQIKKTGLRYSLIEKKLSIPPAHYLGSLLCRHWNLPGIVSDACDAHSFMKESNKTSATRDFKRIIHGANLMAILAGDELSEGSKKSIFKEFSDIFQISESELLELMGNIYDLKLEISDFKL